MKRNIGARIQAARRRAKFSQETLADRISRTPESISNIERGKQMPNVETLAELARVLEVPLANFFEGLEVPDGMRAPSRERAQLEAELQEIARGLAPKLLRVALEQVRILKQIS